MTTHPHGFPPSGTLPAWAGSVADRPPGSLGAVDGGGGFRLGDTGVKPRDTPARVWQGPAEGLC